VLIRDRDIVAQLDERVAEINASHAARKEKPRQLAIPKTIREERRRDSLGLRNRPSGEHGDLTGKFGELVVVK
jgi:hypothetical protein